MRRDTALDLVIESFFRANYDLAPTTEEYYRAALAGFCVWVRKIRRREPIVADLERVLVNAYVKERIATPTRLLRFAFGSFPGARG